MPTRTGAIEGVIPAAPLEGAGGIAARPAIAAPAWARLRRLLTLEHGVAGATFVLMGSYLLSALLGAVQQVLLNAQFGASAEASAFYAAMRLPDLLFNLIAGRALLAAAIPELVATRQTEGEASAWRLTNLILTTVLAVFAVVVLLCEMVAPAFMASLIAPGFDPATSRLASSLTRIMLLQPFILAVGSIATAVLNSRHQFLVAALAFGAHNVAVIAGTAAVIVYPPLGIYGPAIGFVGAGVLQVLIMLPGLWATGFRYRPAWDPADRHLRAVVRLLVPSGIWTGIAYTGFIVDTAFASTATQPAALPAVYNAYLLVGLPISLLGKAAAQSAFPRLAGQVTNQDWPQMRRTVRRLLAAVLGLAVPAAGALLLLGRPTIRMLFEHGKYDAAAGALTYEVLAVYALALPAYVATEVLSRGLIAMRDAGTPLVTSGARLLGRAGLMALLIGTLDALAVPTAFAATAAIEAIVLAAVLIFRIRRRIRYGLAA